MQFVVRGRLVGRQGTRLQPAMTAVSVAVVTGMTLTVSPSFALKREPAPVALTGHGMRAEAQNVAETRLTASVATLVTPRSSLGLAAHAAAMKDKPAQSLAQTSLTTKHAAPVPQGLSAKSGGHEELAPGFAHSVPAATIAATREGGVSRQPTQALARASVDAPPAHTSPGPAALAAGPGPQVSAGLDQNDFHPRSEAPPQVALILAEPAKPADIHPAAGMSLASPSRPQAHPLPAVSADALRWITEGTPDEDDRIFRRPALAGLAGSDGTSLADVSRTSPPSLQAVRNRIEEGLAKRKTPDADPASPADLAQTAALPGAEIANTRAMTEPAKMRETPLATRANPLLLQLASARAALTTPSKRKSHTSPDGTAAVARAPGESLASEMPLTASYKQTPAGVEVTLPLRIRGSQAGAITLLIEGARAGRADVVHREFTVSLAGLLEALRPAMDPAVYARLRNSSSADEYVTLNDLRAAGMTVGFDKNGDLTLG